MCLQDTNILTNMLSNDIFIDSEVLISNIDDDVRLFVKTSAFDEAIRCLEKNNVLMIVGNPGVGKTITSKMIVLNYAGQGYKVRFTTDVTHLSNLKKALSQNLDEKEIILLDEPTIALDPRNRKNLIGLINSFSQLRVIASHDLDMIMDTCSRVVLMNNGKIIREGSTVEILNDRELLESNGLELPLSLSGHR